MVLNISTISIYANSAQSNWMGVDSTGVILKDENCPIQVEKELLTFDVADFPQNHYETVEDYLAYSAKVTGQYHFYNPADYSVTATLVFPFGNAPDYAHHMYDEGYDETGKYNITINEEQIEKKVRHTLFRPYGQQFNVDQDIALLSDGFVSDSFFTLDMPVSKYNYKISGVDTEKYSAANAAIDVSDLNGKTKVLFLECHGFHTQKNGDVRLSSWVKNEDAITVYVFGEQDYIIPKWKFYKNGAVNDKEQIAGQATFVSKETEKSFKEFALDDYHAESGVSESDWYNAKVAYFNSNNNETSSTLSSFKNFSLASNLMRWYEYEITIGAKERIVNAVEAPMYPAINTRYEPPIFKYQYLLSPAKSWADFKNLEIVVNTPYYITESNIDGFIKNDNGYTLTLDSLPDGEFNFTMSTAKNPVISNYGTIIYIMLLLYTVVPIVGVLCVIVVPIIIIGRKRHPELLWEKRRGTK